MVKGARAIKVLTPAPYKREVEAESVAYTICQHYGIDTSDYSFAYIAGYSRNKELPELKASLGRIRDAASEMIPEQPSASFCTGGVKKPAEKSAAGKEKGIFRTGLS